MNCFIHTHVPAVGVCVVCQRGVCPDCMTTGQPRIVCRTCSETSRSLGFEYVSPVRIGSWPLVHVCLAVNPATGRPKIARGVLAVGNVALGGVAIGGVAFGLLALGGVSLGLLLALGGLALGAGISVGGIAVGSIAVGGLAIGFNFAIGGAAFGPAVIDGQHCDEAARAFFRQWFGPGAVPRSCGPAERLF